MPSVGGVIDPVVGVEWLLFSSLLELSVLERKLARDLLLSSLKFRNDGAMMLNAVPGWVARKMLLRLWVGFKTSKAHGLCAIGTTNKRPAHGIIHESLALHQSNRVSLPVNNNNLSAASAAI